MAAGDDAETLAAGTCVVELAADAAGTVVPAFVWHERGGYRVVAVEVVTLARRSNACAKLIVNYRSTGRCISILDVIGSPRPVVNKFIAWAEEALTAVE
jgi:hypothetical protein